MQGKGTVLTYWLTNENPEVRRARLNRTHLRFSGRDSTESATPPFLRPLFSNSPYHSLNTTPQNSPMLPGGQTKGRVKLADGASTIATSPLVHDVIKDSDSGKGSDPLNGINQHRVRLHSFREALQKCHKWPMTSNNSNPDFTLQGRAATSRFSGNFPVPDVLSSPVDSSVIPVLKCRRHDNDSRISIYDNKATPTEMSVLLGVEDEDGGQVMERETPFV